MGRQGKVTAHMDIEDKVKKSVVPSTTWVHQVPLRPAGFINSKPCHGAFWGLQEKEWGMVGAQGGTSKVPRS